MTRGGLWADPWCRGVTRGVQRGRAQFGAALLEGGGKENGSGVGRRCREAAGTLTKRDSTARVPLGAGRCPVGHTESVVENAPRTHRGARFQKLRHARGGRRCVVQGVSRAALAIRSLSSRATPR